MAVAPPASLHLFSSPSPSPSSSLSLRKSNLPSILRCSITSTTPPPPPSTHKSPHQPQPPPHLRRRSPPPRFPRPPPHAAVARTRPPRPVDKWSPSIAALQQSMDLLHRADDTVDGVAAAFRGHDRSFSHKDVVTIINNMQGSWKKALAFFRWLQQSGHKHNAFAYNVLLKTLRRDQQWEIAQGLIDDMIMEGLEPDNVTYSTIISFAIRCQLPEEALRWYERMQQAGCAPDAWTYNTMIDVYGRIGHLDQAFKLFRKLKKEGIHLDSVTYATMMKLHGMRGNFKEILNIYNEMRRKKIPLTAGTFNSIIGVFGRGGRNYQVQAFLNDMQILCVEPSEITLSLLFRMYSRGRLTDEAFELFNMIMKNGWKADTAVYNALLNLCAEAGLVEEGRRVYGEMLQSDQCKPDDWTWKTLVDMYARAGMMEEARAMFQKLLEAGYKADSTVFTFLLQGHGKKKDFKAVVESFEEMVELGVVFDGRLIGALLSVLVSCKEEENFQLILQCIEKANPRLARVVEMLVQVDLENEALKEEMGAMLLETRTESRRPFCNLLIELCWNRNLGARTQLILDLAVSSGSYPVLQSRSSLEWCLRLRTLSFGAARTSLQNWVRSLNAAAQEGQDLPPSVGIEAGLGKQRLPKEVAMSEFVSSQLQEIQAPFTESKEKSGWFKATGEEVKSWLQSKEASIIEAFLHQNTWLLSLSGSLELATA